MFPHLFYYFTFRRETGKVTLIDMHNYTVQFRYNGKEDSIPFRTEIECKASEDSIVLNTKVRPFVKQYLESKSLWKGNGFMEELRLYGKDGELIFDLNEFKR